MYSTYNDLKRVMVYKSALQPLLVGKRCYRDDYGLVQPNMIPPDPGTSMRAAFTLRPGAGGGHFESATAYASGAGCFKLSVNS